MRTLLIPLLFLLLWLFNGTVIAANGTPSLSAMFLKKYNDAQAALAQQQPKTARTLLEELTANKNNNAYENGLAWSMLGLVHFQTNALEQSASAYEKALQFDIPAALAQENRKNLGQVHQANGNCQRATTLYEQWLKQAPERDSADVHVWAAQCHYQLARYRNAVQHLMQAISATTRNGQPPKETWLTLLQASQAQLKDAKDRIDTLKMLLRWYPKTDYWLALASAFGQLDRMDDYLAGLAVAERRQLLNTEAQYLTLAGAYYEAGIPWRAARILEQGMQKKRVKTSVRNLRFLASCYTMAQEFDKALVPLQKAVAQTSDSETAALLGNALFQLARWNEAAKALETALLNGGGKQRDTLWLMLGQAYLNQQQYAPAIDAFKQVLPVEARSKQAQQWINYANYERKRHQELGLTQETKP